MEDVRSCDVIINTPDHVAASDVSSNTKGRQADSSPSACNHNAHNSQKPDVCTSITDCKRSRNKSPCVGDQDDDDDDAEIEELVEEIQVLNPSTSNAGVIVDVDVTVDVAAENAAREADPNVFLMTDDSTDDRHGSRTVRIKHSIVVICDVSKMLTPVGLIKSVVLLSCIVGLGCLCATDYPALVVSTPARFHIFSLTFTLLTVLVVFLHEILTLLLLFPINWPRLNALVHAAVFLLLFGSSSVLVHALFANQRSMPRLDNTVEMIMISGISGYFGAVLCLMTSAMACCCYDHHLTVPWKQHSDSLLLLK